MDLIRDVLDKQLLAKNEKPMGKADGIVVEVRAGAPPRVAFVEVGAVTLARRLDPRLVPLARRLTALWGDREGVCRIPWSKVLVVGMSEIKVDVDAEATSAFALERRARERVV